MSTHLPPPPGSPTSPSAARTTWTAQAVLPVRSVSAADRSLQQPAGSACRPALYRQLVASDVPLRPRERARSLRSWLPRAAVVVTTTAAWVHLGGAAPEVLHVATATPRRLIGAHLCGHTQLYPDSGLVLLGSVVVTNQLQTAADLARAAGLAGPGSPELEWLRRMLASAVDPADVYRRLRSEPRRAASRLSFTAMGWAQQELAQREASTREMTPQELVPQELVPQQLAPPEAAPPEPMPRGAAAPGKAVQSFGAGRPEGTGAASGRTPVTR